MLSRVIYIVVGILVIYNGFAFLEQDYLYRFGIEIYIGKNRYLVASACFIFGLFLIIFAVRKKFTHIFSDTTIYLKCLCCGELFDEDEKPHLQCPKCGGDLENIEGFYDRHPELKEDKKEIKNGREV